MGSSSFSIIPGIYNLNGLVIYTWNKYFKPLKHWISDDSIDLKKQNIIKKIKLELWF